MTANVPRTVPGKDALNKINTALPKFQHESKPLKAIVISKQTRLYEITKHPELLAIRLQEMNKFTAYGMGKIKAQDTDFDKNVYLYDIILSDEHAAPEFIRALEDSGNEHVIPEIAACAATTDAPDGKVNNAGALPAAASSNNVPAMAANSNPTIPSISIIVGSNSKVVGAVIGNNNPIDQSDTSKTKKHSTVPSYDPLELANLQRRAKRKIAELEYCDEDYCPYDAFFEEYEEEYLNNTAKPDQLAEILFTLEVLNATQRENVISKATKKEKNKIIYNVIKHKKKMHELITALGQIGDDATLKLIDLTASSGIPAEK